MHRTGGKPSWADMCRQRAADAKQKAAQAKDPSIKSAFEHVAAGWAALADQVERIDRERSFLYATKKTITQSANAPTRRTTSGPGLATTLAQVSALTN